MALTKDQKRRAKRELFSLSTDGERADMTIRELETMEESIDQLLEAVSRGQGDSQVQVRALVQTLSEEMRKVRISLASQNKQSAEVFDGMKREFLSGLKEMGMSLTKQSESQAFNKNAGPLYKTMIGHLSGMEKSFANWKYPQYASVSVRDTNFSNVNPAIAGFNITSPYDYIELTYSGSNITTVVYKSGGASGRTVATLTLAYSGSNITSVTRT